jgi:hypothetical protein
MRENIKQVKLKEKFTEYMKRKEKKEDKKKPNGSILPFEPFSARPTQWTSSLQLR